MRRIKFDFVYEFIKGDLSKFYIHRKYTLDEIMANMPQKISMMMTDYPECISCSLIAKRPYTGRKDKNGKEIYKGDALRYADNDDYKFIVLKETNTSNLYLSIINGVYKGLSWDLAELSQNTFEIIDNVYENPELLKD